MKTYIWHLCVRNQFYGLAIGAMVLAASYAAGPISGGLINPAITIGADLAGAGLDPSRMAERDQAKQEFMGEAGVPLEPRCRIWEVPHLCSLSAVYDSGDSGDLVWSHFQRSSVVGLTVAA